MAERKAKPVTKKVAVTKAASAAAGKPKTTKAVLAVTPKKAVAKKTATATAKPKNIKTPTTKPKNTKPPVVKKAVVPAAKKKAPVQKAVTTKAKLAAKKSVAQLTPEERYRMVQTAAYFIAERHGFSGRSADHWVAAELEIAGKLGQ